MSTLGASLEVKGVGYAMDQTAAGSQQIDHDQAAQYMKDQGYDPSVLPAGNVQQGTLRALVNQQSAIARDTDMANRAHMGGFTQGAAALTGSFLDPIFLAAGPVAGRAFGVATKGAGLLTRCSAALSRARSANASRWTTSQTWSDRLRLRRYRAWTSIMSCHLRELLENIKLPRIRRAALASIPPR
jgi:hypothetical protein